MEDYDFLYLVFGFICVMVIACASAHAERSVTAYADGEAMELHFTPPTPRIDSSGDAQESATTPEEKTLTINAKDLIAVKNCGRITTVEGRDKCVRHYSDPWAHHFENGEYAI